MAEPRTDNKINDHLFKDGGTTTTMLSERSISNNKRYSSSLEAILEARKLWLAADSQSDLDKVEQLYKWALSSKESSPLCGDGNGNGPSKKRQKNGGCGLNRSEFIQAGEKLALLLCQSGRPKKAKKGLISMGFTCRLSQKVLDYPEEGTEPQSFSSGNAGKSPCQIVDKFLSRAELERLRSVFESPSASYWGDHNYSVEPPSPYFSYVIPMKDTHRIPPSKCSIKKQSKQHESKLGFIGSLIQKIISCPVLLKKFPKLSNANYVEMWAHNRPHASGHQMHFDSDDEGRGGARNPIISTILYVTPRTEKKQANEEGEKNMSHIGGPSLVTNQKLSDISLATEGWLAHPNSERLVAFDGRYLHGVVPGKGVRKGRRVTLMFAFWEEIRIRDGDGPGSARPFPCRDDVDDVPEWAKLLTAPCAYCDKGGGVDGSGSFVESEPIKIDVIYETLDGKPWKRGMGMPAYEQVFQGF